MVPAARSSCHVAGERRSRSPRRDCPSAVDSLHGLRQLSWRSTFTEEFYPARLRPALLIPVPPAANRQSRGPGRCPYPDKSRKRDAQSFSDQDYVRRWSLACVDFCDVSYFKLLIVFSCLSALWPPVHPSSILGACNGDVVRSHNPGSAAIPPCIPVTA